MVLNTSGVGYWKNRKFSVFITQDWYISISILSAKCDGQKTEKDVLQIRRIKIKNYIDSSGINPT